MPHIPNIDPAELFGDLIGEEIRGTIVVPGFAPVDVTMRRWPDGTYRNVAPITLRPLDDQ